MSEFKGVGAGRVEDDSVTYRGSLGWAEASADRSSQRCDVRVELEGQVSDVEAVLVGILDSLRAVKV